MEGWQEHRARGEGGGGEEGPSPNHLIKKEYQKKE